MIDIGAISSGDGNLSRPLYRLAKLAGALLVRMDASGSNAFGPSFYPQRLSRPVIFKSLGANLRIDEISFVDGLSDDYCMQGR